MGCGASKSDVSPGGASAGPGSTAKQAQTSGVTKQVPGPSLPTDLSPEILELDVSGSTGLTDLVNVGTYSKLTKLDANSCALTGLPSEIEACTALEELLVYANKIKDVPKEVGKCEALTTLNFFNNQIKKLPVEIGALSNLDEVNVAANKLMMLTDAHFTASWASVKILNLYDNNLVRMGSLAPLTGLEELRINGNNLEDLPTLSTHSKLKILEMHKNRFASAADDYFKATPALERLRIDGNMLKALPSSLLACGGLTILWAQENQLESLPAGAWPTKLETLFLQSNESLTSLTPELKEAKALKRVNVTGLKLDEASMAIMKDVRMMCLTADGGMFWTVDGKKETN